MSEPTETQVKQSKIEEFFRDAFCAVSAEIIPTPHSAKLPGAIIKIVCGDHRGTLYISKVDGCGE